MKNLIGKKLGMTQIYDEQGRIVPVTVIQAGPCVVVDVKTRDRDGYSAVQLGFGAKKAKNVSKAVLGHCAKAGYKTSAPTHLREFRTCDDADIAIGTELKADVFAENDYLDVTGTIKGRGFQGVVKRYNFGGGRAAVPVLSVCANSPAASGSANACRDIWAMFGGQSRTCRLSG